MTRQRADSNNPPPSLQEQYECATVTSDLGLPHGPGAGAQGILAAAAWTQVHVGSALIRLRTQWERDKPVRHFPRTRQQLMAAGMTREAARAMHKRERTELAQSYFRRRLSVFAGLRELAECREGLTLYAAACGMEDADLKALTILQQWLDGRHEASFGEEGRKLLAYLDDCLQHARDSLRRGIAGRTDHQQEREQQD